MTSVQDDRRERLPSVLFLDKVFLKRAQDPLRGVELFNLNLLNELLALGYPVTLVAEKSWREPVLAATEKSTVTGLWFGALGPDALGVLAAAWRLRVRRFDRLLVGNVGNGLIPLLKRLNRRRAFGRAVLIAHREASVRFVRLWSRLPGCVVAVNEQIARPFRQGDEANVHVDYGIFHGDRYFPSTARQEKPVRFIVLGALDNPWKGADTAQAAFARLPASFRARAELHLASFRNPPPVAEHVVAHPWLSADQIPDLLRGMHVMICPSRDEMVMRETFSQAMVQGMLSGLPVLASDLPILKEKLDRGGGCIFRDVDELTALMEQMIKDSARREALGREARSTALERYVWDTRRFAIRYLEPPA